MLDIDHDPKLAWALRNRHLFPVDLNKADKRMILRVPGLGAKTARKILSIRRYTNISWVDLTKMRIALEKIKPFIVVSDYYPSMHLLDHEHLAQRLKQPEQMSLFGGST